MRTDKELKDLLVPERASFPEQCIGHWSVVQAGTEYMLLDESNDGIAGFDTEKQIGTYADPDYFEEIRDAHNAQADLVNEVIELRDLIEQLYSSIDNGELSVNHAIVPDDLKQRMLEVIRRRR